MEDIIQTQIKGKQEIDDIRESIRILEQWAEQWKEVKPEAWSITMKYLNQLHKKLRQLTINNK